MFDARDSTQAFGRLLCVMLPVPLQLEGIAG